MLKTEFLEIIANGENYGVEFKRDDIRLRQLEKAFISGIRVRTKIVPLTKALTGKEPEFVASKDHSV